MSGHTSGQIHRGKYSHAACKPEKADVIATAEETSAASALQRHPAQCCSCVSEGERERERVHFTFSRGPLILLIYYLSGHVCICTSVIQIRFSGIFSQIKTMILYYPAKF